MATTWPPRFAADADLGLAGTVGGRELDAFDWDGMGWDLFLSAAQDDARPLSAGSESLGLGRGGRHLRLNEYASCRGSSPHALAHGTTNLPAFSCKELKTRYGWAHSLRKKEFKEHPMQCTPTTSWAFIFITQEVNTEKRDRRAAAGFTDAVLFRFCVVVHVLARASLRGKA